MDILDELAERFSITLDTELVENADYLKATALLHELAASLPEETAAELDDYTSRLTAAAFSVGVKSGLRLGAKIAAGLLNEK